MTRVVIHRDHERTVLLLEVKQQVAVADRPEVVGHLQREVPGGGWSDRYCRVLESGTRVRTFALVPFGDLDTRSTVNIPFLRSRDNLARELERPYERLLLARYRFEAWCDQEGEPRGEAGEASRFRLIAEPPEGEGNEEPHRDDDNDTRLVRGRKQVEAWCRETGEALEDLYERTSLGEGEVHDSTPLEAPSSLGYRQRYLAVTSRTATTPRRELAAARRAYEQLSETINRADRALRYDRMFDVVRGLRRRVAHTLGDGALSGAFGTLLLTSLVVWGGVVAGNEIAPLLGADSPEPVGPEPVAADDGGRAPGGGGETSTPSEPAPADREASRSGEASSGAAGGGAQEEATQPSGIPDDIQIEVSSPGDVPGRDAEPGSDRSTPLAATRKAVRAVGGSLAPAEVALMTGVWSGTVPAPDGEERAAQIRLLRARATNESSLAGHVTYSGEPGCLGWIRLAERTDHLLQFAETIRCGAGPCQDGGVLVLGRLGDGTLAVHHRWPDGPTANARVFTRPEGPVPPAPNLSSSCNASR